MLDKTVKVACVQAAPVYLDLDRSVDKGISLIAEAAANGAQLINFPETWLPGYPWFAWLDAPLWGLQFFAAYHKNSLEIGSPQMARLQAAAKKHRIAVGMGFSERDGGSLYMAQCLIGEDGELKFTRRKLKPTHVERTLYGEGDGSDFKVVDTDLGRVGALCCWEHFQPLSRFAMYSMQEQIHLAAWPSFSLYRGAAYALGPEVNLAASRTYAVEGQCFVLASSAIVSQEMIDMLCDTPAKKQLLNSPSGGPGGGGSMIFGPDGRELCEALPEDEEGILYADLDMTMIRVAKAAADPVGHYSRPDVVRLMLNRSKTPRVQSFTEPPFGAPTPIEEEVAN